MSKQHIVALDYIRGLSMLGVLGIHTGSYALSYPAAGPHLIAVLEILTRFSVPIFFFVSAFGLFASQPLNTEFNYLSFMRRRFKAVLLPYLAWSLLYMLHYTWVSGDASIWTKSSIIKYYIFGLASYQLYFLVILIWFYTLMPLWRQLVRLLIKAPATGLSLLLAVQIVFNYYSSYLLKPGVYNHYLNLAVQHRMNYLILHYLFIFILGAICAELYPQFQVALKHHKRKINVFFSTTLVGMLLAYYYFIYFKHYSLEAVVNTVHQLSPIGVLYTVGATLFLFKTFNHSLPRRLATVLNQLGEHSYFIYLVHPLVMYYLSSELTKASLQLTPPIIVVFYLATLAFSTSLSLLVTTTGRLIPLLSLALTGSFPKQNSFRQKA